MERNKTLMFKLEDDDEPKGSDAEEVETDDEEIEDGADDDEGADDDDDGKGDDEDWKARALKAEGILKRKSKPKKAPVAAPAAPAAEPVDIDSAVQKALDKRDLDGLDLPDELKKEVKKIARVQGISIAKAVEDPYIAFRKSQIETKDEEEGASISRTDNGKPAPSKSDKPPKVDMSTEEGRKTWEEYQKKQRGA